MTLATQHRTSWPQCDRHQQLFSAVTWPPDVALGQRPAFSKSVLTVTFQCHSPFPRTFLRICSHWLSIKVASEVARWPHHGLLPSPTLQSCALEDGLGLVTHIQQREQDKSDRMLPEVALYKDCGPLSALGHQLPCRGGSGAACTEAQETRTRGCQQHVRAWKLPVRGLSASVGTSLKLARPGARGTGRAHRVRGNNCLSLWGNLSYRRKSSEVWRGRHCCHNRQTWATCRS